MNATTEEYFLAADLSIPYYSEFHLNYRIYAGVMIALWPLGVPLWMVRYFLRNRKGVIAMANAELRAEYKLELDAIERTSRCAADPKFQHSLPPHVPHFRASPRSLPAAAPSAPPRSPRMRRRRRRQRLPPASTLWRVPKTPQRRPRRRRWP